jgi:DDE family transposase
LQGVFTKKGSLFAQERQRAAAMLKRGLVLLTEVRKNMKALPLTLTDRPLLNARNMAETIIGHIKAFSSLSLPKTALRSMLSCISWLP